MIFMSFNTHHICRLSVAHAKQYVRNPYLKHRHLCILTEHCCKQKIVSAPQSCLHIHCTEVTQWVQ